MRNLRPVALFSGLLLLSISGCSLSFGDSSVAVPLIGDPIEPSAFPKLNDRPVGDLYIRDGADSGQWAVMYEATDAQLAAPMAMAMPEEDRMHLVRLDLDGP